MCPEQEGAEVSRAAAIPAVPQAAVAASQALLTGLASSRAASKPRSLHHAPAWHQHSRRQVFLPRCHEAAQETRKANTCASQKPAGRGCCIERACPPRSGSRACERRGAAAEPQRSSIPAPEPAPRCRSSARVSCHQLPAILTLKPPRRAQPGRFEILSIISRTPPLAAHNPGAAPRPCPARSHRSGAGQPLPRAAAVPAKKVAAAK